MRHIFYFSMCKYVNSPCNTAKFVCMNTLISLTISVRAIKLGDNISYYNSQIKNVLEFKHAPFRLHKSIKTGY